MFQRNPGPLRGALKPDNCDGGEGGGIRAWGGLLIGLIPMDGSLAVLAHEGTRSSPSAGALRFLKPMGPKPSPEP